MAPDNSYRKPGSRGGMFHILTEKFAVSAQPTLDRADVASRIRGELGKRGIAGAEIYLSDAPVRRGALFDLVGKRVPFPPDATYDRCFVALIDPDRTARWAHDAYWAFVPADGVGEVALQETRLPEHERGPVRLELLR